MVLQHRSTELITRNIGLMFIDLGAQVVSNRDDIQHISGLSQGPGAWIEVAVAALTSLSELLTGNKMSKRCKRWTSKSKQTKNPRVLTILRINNEQSTFFLEHYVLSRRVVINVVSCSCEMF